MRYGVMPPERLGTTKLPNGRALGWAEWGPEAGRPVLFFSGAGMSRWLGFGGDFVAPAQIRLIGVERPGLGASDPEPRRTLVDWASDIRALAEARRLGPFSVVGFSQGAPFALACAASGVAKAAAIVAGQDDLTYPGFSSVLHPDVQRMLEAASADPTAFEASFARDVNAAVLWGLVVGMSAEIDRRVYTDPAFEVHYRRALEEGFSQGAAGYARDLSLSMRAFPFELARIAIPVDLWYGGQDASPVHSPDHGETLARRIPGARRHFLPEAGGSLLWTHAGEILESLVAQNSV